MAKNTEKKELQQTRGEFKVTGTVLRIDTEKAYVQDVQEKGKNEGRPYRKLAFTVKTSEENEVRVEMFAYRPDKVFLWNSELNKEAKEKGKKYSGERVDYEDWKENREEYAEKGYAVLESRVGVEYLEDGSLDTRSQPAYLTAKDVYDALENGDSVTVKGDVRHSSWVGQDGNEVKKTQYSMKQVYRTKKDVDFDSEEFEEISYFEDEVVFVSADVDPEDKKRLIVTGRTIDYNGNFVDNRYIIDANDPELVKLGQTAKKRFKFGDKIKFFGQIVNRAEVGEEDEHLNEEDAFLASLGGKKKPKHAQRFTFKNYIQELLIEGVSEFKEKFYSDEDFFDSGFAEDESDKNMEEFGGKKKKKDDDDPFADDNSFDIDADELPF